MLLFCQKQTGFFVFEAEFVNALHEDFIIGLLLDVVIENVFESAFALEDDLFLGSFHLGFLKHFFSLHFHLAVSFTNLIFCVFVFLSILEVIEDVVPTSWLLLVPNLGSFVAEVWVPIAELGHSLLDLVELLSLDTVALDSYFQIFFELKFHDWLLLGVEQFEMSMRWSLSLADKFVIAGLTPSQAHVQVSKV